MSRAGRCAALAAIILVLGSRGLETAIANGDTRTLTMHHIHTEEDITITYKRDGKYDEEALKQLDWFVRDWRQEESIHMDPALYDLVWEVAREAGSDQPIQVVCGYRSPKTNAMLRRRTNGVAQHSQHILGKAMDFYVPGAPLEELRAVGLRLQRGGVGYYPTSGAPFVHLDVGPVRHWGPAVSHELMARLSNGRANHVASESQPSAGNAQALADIEKHGSATLSQASLREAHGGTAAAAHIKAASVVADDDEDAAETAAATPAAPAAPVPHAPAARRSTYTLASAETHAVAPMPAARPLRAPQAATPAEAEPPAAQPERQDWAYATETPRPPGTVKGVVRPAAGDGDITGAMAWPVRAADNDHVPLDMVMAYAAQPLRDPAPALRPEPIAEAPLRGTAAPRTATLRDNAPRDIVNRDNVTTIAKKTFVRPTAAEPVVRAKPVVAANAGMRYDDPWLRAMIVTPSLSSAMTATLYGEPDLTELRALMAKPNSTVLMSFTDEAYPGIASNRFSGEAVVFLTTRAFERRTASLR